MVACARRFSAALFLAVACLTATGCAGSEDDLPREPVSGTVTMDDQPLAEGTIQFTPTAGGGAGVGGGSPIENGRFSIARDKGLVPGSYRVAINASDQKSRGEPTKKGPVKKGLGLAKELIPSKYNSGSTLTAEIKKGGSDDLKYDLQSK